MSAPVHDETGLSEGRPANQCAAGFHGLVNWIEFPLNITKRKFEFFHICENAYARMKEELQAIDTDSLKARLNELRRYL